MVMTSIKCYIYSDDEMILKITQELEKKKSVLPSFSLICFKTLTTQMHAQAYIHVLTHTHTTHTQQHMLIVIWQQYTCILIICKQPTYFPVVCSIFLSVFMQMLPTRQETLRQVISITMLCLLKLKCPEKQTMFHRNVFSFMFIFWGFEVKLHV